MRLMGLTVGLALFAAATHAADMSKKFDAETVGSMHELCKADETMVNGKYALGFCYGWIEGLGQFYEQLLLDERFKFTPSVCPGKELTREEVRATFIDWAEANPGSADEPPIKGILSAMKEKYPCK